MTAKQMTTRVTGDVADEFFPLRNEGWGEEEVVVRVACVACEFPTCFVILFVF